MYMLVYLCIYLPCVLHAGHLIPERTYSIPPCSMGLVHWAWLSLVGTILSQMVELHSFNASSWICGTVGWETALLLVSHMTGSIIGLAPPFWFSFLILHLGGNRKWPSPWMPAIHFDCVLPWLFAHIWEMKCKIYISFFSLSLPLHPHFSAFQINKSLQNK